jgi:hypothetical protein
MSDINGLCVWKLCSAKTFKYKQVSKKTSHYVKVIEDILREPASCRGRTHPYGGSWIKTISLGWVHMFKIT